MKLSPSLHDPRTYISPETFTQSSICILLETLDKRQRHWRHWKETRQALELAPTGKLPSSSDIAPARWHGPSPFQTWSGPSSPQGLTCLVKTWTNTNKVSLSSRPRPWETPARENKVLQPHLKTGPVSQPLGGQPDFPDCQPQIQPP